MQSPKEKYLKSLSSEKPLMTISRVFTKIKLYADRVDARYIFKKNRTVYLKDADIFIYPDVLRIVPEGDYRKAIRCYFHPKDSKAYLVDFVNHCKSVGMEFIEVKEPASVDTYSYVHKKHSEKDSETPLMKINDNSVRLELYTDRVEAYGFGEKITVYLKDAEICITRVIRDKDASKFLNIVSRSNRRDKIALCVNSGWDGGGGWEKFTDCCSSNGVKVEWHGFFVS